MKRIAEILLVLISAAAAASAQKAIDAPLDVLLQRMATYLADYEKALGGVVLEEHYTQSLLAKGALGFGRASHRELKSDLVSVQDATYGWTAFRDVFAVDAEPVRDRDQRLQNLFVAPKADVLSQAKQIANEGARFNLGHVARNVNFPTMALTFLGQKNQPRLKFKRKGTEKIGSIDTAKIEFQELQKPSIVRGIGADLFAQGTVWIDPETGRIIKTVLQFDAREFTNETTVTYALVDRVKLWLPASMTDTITGALETVKGAATYTNARQFGVSTNAVIK